MFLDQKLFYIKHSVNIKTLIWSLYHCVGSKLYSTELQFGLDNGMEVNNSEVLP
jgi:hypothetical protein